MKQQIISRKVFCIWHCQINFSLDILKCIFLNEIYCTDESAMVRVKAWHGKTKKLLPEPMNNKAH